MDSGVWHKQGRSIRTGLLIVIAAVLSVWALRATYAVTMPLAFAILVAMLVQPLRRSVSDRVPERWSWLGVVAAMLAVLAVVALFLGAIWLSIEIVGGKAPQYAQKIEGHWDNLVDWARQNHLPIPPNVADGAGLGGRIGGIMMSVLGSISDVVAFLVLIFFFALLALLEVRAWRDKIGTIIGADRMTSVLDSIEKIGAQIRAYLLIRTVLGLISGFLAFLWLLLTGVDFAFVWGFLAFLLNYVPNIGSIIAGGLASLFALVQFGPGWALFVAAGLLLIEQVIGNFVDPKLQGRTLSISPLIVLVSVIFWGWVWGISGALLGVPITVAMIATCAHLRPLRPVALLLSRTADEDVLVARTHCRATRRR